MIQARLAGFAAGLRWESLPSPVRAQVRVIVLDALASALSGRRASGLVAVERVAHRLGGGVSTVIGGDSASLVGAALLNGFQTTATTVCDVYRPALCHVTPEVVPAALGVAEERGEAGRDLLAAVAAGLEVTVRLGRACDYPAFRAAGWHAPGVIGPFGAAAAAGRVLALDADPMADALGLAGSQSAGTFAGLGTPAIKFHQARGAVSGLLAALLAAGGFRGARDVLTHPDGGFFGLYCSGGEPDAAVRGLGEEWELERIGLRLWPVASSLQAVVDCALELAPAGVRSAVVSLPPGGYGLCGAVAPETPLAAQQSARYVAAVVLHDRACWLEQFAAERIAALAPFALERVTAVEDASLPPYGAALEVVAEDGARRTAVRQDAKGDPADPLSADDVRAKLRLAAASAAVDPGPILDAWEGLETAPSVGPLCAALRGVSR